MISGPNLFVCPQCGSTGGVPADESTVATRCIACTHVSRTVDPASAPSGYESNVATETPKIALPGDESASTIIPTGDPVSPYDLHPLSDERTFSFGGAPGDSDAPFTGRRFGDYELLHVIARGGMGVVVKARQTKLNRLVALKLILGGKFVSEEHVRRFQIEAEAAARLDHPGIVPVYEVGEFAGQHFYSMGLVEGANLAGRLANGPLPPREAAELVLKATRAVAYAHERGVVHRDIKPANILLDQAGQPRVTDFGLAKQIEDDSHLTKAGGVLGTPSYMPPEQAAGRSEEVGPRADIYALGATLYCLLTARPPFQAAHVAETLRQVIEQDPVSPRRLNPAVDRDLETICLKCLEKTADRRYATANALADDLEAFLGGHPVNARPLSAAGRLARWARRKPALASLSAAVAAVTLGGIVGIAWQWREAQANFDESQTQRTQAEANFAVARQTVERFLTIAPNHELIQRPGMEPLKAQLQTLGRDYYLKLVVQEPQDRDARLGLASAHFFLGMTLEDLGDRPGAAEEYSAAANAFRHLHNIEPADANHTRNLGAAYGNLANVQIEMGKRSEAIESYRLASDAQATATDANPGDLQGSLQLAATHLNLSLLEIEDGQFDSAMKSVVRSKEMVDRLQERLAGNPGLLILSAKVLSTEGRIWWERKDDERAMAAYGLSADVYRALLIAQPDALDFHSELGGVLNDLAGLQTGNGKHDEAAQTWSAGIEHVGIAHEKAPEVQRFNEQLATLHRGRALFRRNTHRFDAALTDLTAARSLRSQDPQWLFNTASDLATYCVFIDERRAALTPETIAARDEYADLAVEWLVEAVRSGFRDAATIREAAALNGIRDRPAFAQVGELLEHPTPPD